MSVPMRVRGRVWGWMVVGAVGVGALAQQPGEPAATVGTELRELASCAGVVFVGQVAKVEAKDGVVEITFTVEQPVLGAVGGSYVMREWAGRWTGGQQHFQAGQRAMFFLQAPNAAGLSSAVDGMVGAVPVVPMGANGAALLDIRWVATRLKRAVGSPLVGAGEGAVLLSDGVVVVKGWQGELVAEPRVIRLPDGVVGAVSPVQVPRPGPVAGPIPIKEAVDVQH